MCLCGYKIISDTNLNRLLKAQFNYFFVDLKYILNAKSAKFFFEIIENIFKVREGVKLSKDFFVIIF